MPASSLDKFRPGYVAPAATPDVITEAGIRLVPYKAYVSDSLTRPSHLMFKSGLYGINKIGDQAFPYGCLTIIDTDGYGFVITLLFSLPAPGPMVVQITGEGLVSLVDAILKGTAAEVQVFDPARFLPAPAGEWNTAGHKWKGEPLIKEILIYDKPREPQTAH